MKPLSTTIKDLFTTIKNGVLTIYLRLKAKTPSFFNKLRIACVTLSGWGLAMTGAGIETDFKIWGMDVPKLCALLGFFGTVFASLAVQNPDDAKPTPPNI